MSKYKKLLGNSLLFAVGNLGSKLINIILVPLYTYYLSTTEYGLVDVVQTTAKMLLPIISLSIFDGVLRFVMDKEEDPNAVFTNGIMITTVGSLIALLIYPILESFNLLDGLMGYMIVILILQAYQSLFAQFSRAIGAIKTFAVNGLLMAIVTGLMNILLLIQFDMGISGYLLSMVIANLFSVFFIAICVKGHRYFKVKTINKSLIKKMLVYSIPLIPNAFMWWVINASNRYFIVFFIGASANGLFAVANKIPTLLSVLNTIFFQAWQLSAIEEFESKDKSKFFSEVFSYFQMVMLLGASAIIVIIKLAMHFFVAPEYYSAWEYIPFLLLGVVFSSYSGFIGANYIAAKETKGVFKTSIIGGIINLLANIILIPVIGVNGAGLATMISFFAMWVLRVYDTRKFINLKVNVTNLVLNLIVIFVQTYILFVNLATTTNLIIQSLLFILLLVINKSLWIPIIQLIQQRKK